MRQLSISAFCCALLSTAVLAGEPDRQAILRKIGTFPMQGSIGQKTQWCRVAVFISYGQWDPSKEKWVMWNTTPDNLIDACARTNGRY